MFPKMLDLSFVMSFEFVHSAESNLNSVLSTARHWQLTEVPLPISFAHSGLTRLMEQTSDYWRRQSFHQHDTQTRTTCLILKNMLWLITTYQITI
jgi:hypothetical protein